MVITSCVVSHVVMLLFQTQLELLRSLVTEALYEEQLQQVTTIFLLYISPQNFYSIFHLNIYFSTYL